MVFSRYFSDFTLKLPKQKSSLAPDYVWTNADQDPVPVSKRTWTRSVFVLYWFSDLINVAGWAAPASVVAVGLTATDAIWITLVAGICNAIPTVLNGAIGADLHIPFPVIIRSSYGYWLSYFCVFSRGILALFWFGIQSTGGGYAVAQMITAIWPSFATLPNHLPESAYITTSGMISYFVYHVLQTPFLLIPTHKLKWMFLAKSILLPPMALAMCIYLAAKAGSGGDFFHQEATVSGSTRVWLWLASMTSLTGGFSTLTVNIPDFSRFAKKPGHQVWQLPFIPFFMIVISILGIVSASATKSLYGTVLWQPLDIVAKWQTSPGGRAAAFFCSALWCLAQICVNISANAISFGNDITSFFPKYFNIRRGVIFAVFIGGWAMVPWIILSSALTFLNFMAAYALFMAPIAGIMFTDYWLVKNKHYDVPALYDPRGRYHTWNWRALAVTILVVTPLLPALANKVTPQNVSIPDGLSNLFAINWLYGFITSIVLFYVVHKSFPDRQTLIPATIHGDEVVEGAVDDLDKNSDNMAEKGVHQVTTTLETHKSS